MTTQQSNEVKTPLEVKYFASSHLRSILTDANNVHVVTISQYLRMPVNMWHIWGKYTYKDHEFDIDVEIWQNGKNLEVCKRTQVWSI